MKKQPLFVLFSLFLVSLFTAPHIFAQVGAHARAFETTVAGKATAEQAASGQGTLAAKPPMGWNSWNKFACDVSEKLIRENADAGVSSGKKDAGHQLVNIDECWQSSRAAH